MSARAAVTVTTRPLWLMGLAARCLRVLLCLAAATGVIVTARDAIAPTRPVVSAGPRPDLPDAGAEGFAELFARRYLSWNAGDPGAYAQTLAAFGGPALPAGAGVTLPAGGTQQVQWTRVLQGRGDGSGGHVYTVAAQTDVAGLLYLAVPVRRGPDGRLSLGGYPGFVGAPATSVFVDGPARLTEVADSSLQQVVVRALRNYLAGSASNLAADLSADARVSEPPLSLSLDHVSRLAWSPDGRSVDAELVASDSRGVVYTLGYEIDVRLVDARWELSAIAMDPNT